MSAVSASKRIRIDPTSELPLRNVTICKSEEREDEIESITELPNDMIDVITSNLHVIDIIHLEKTCKLFENICKRNSNELIDYIHHKYCKFLVQFTKNKNPNKKYKFKYLKRLIIWLHSQINGSQPKLIAPLIKYHTHLNYFELNISGNFNDEISDQLLIKNINNSNITINKLTIWNKYNKYYGSLIQKCNNNAIKLKDISLTNDMFNLLTQLPIKMIEFDNCKYRDNIKLLNLKEWNCLTHITIESDEFINKLLIEPPNLRHIKMIPFNIYHSHNFKTIKKIGKNICNLELMNFWGCINSYKPFMDSPKEQFVLSKIKLIDISVAEEWDGIRDDVKCCQVIMDALDWSQTVKINISKKGQLFVEYLREFFSSKEATKHLQFEWTYDTKISLMLTKKGEMIQLTQL